MHGETLKSPSYVYLQYQFDVTAQLNHRSFHSQENIRHPSKRSLGGPPDPAWAFVPDPKEKKLRKIRTTAKTLSIMAQCL